MSSPYKSSQSSRSKSANGPASSSLAARSRTTATATAKARATSPMKSAGARIPISTPNTTRINNRSGGANLAVKKPTSAVNGTLKAKKVPPVPAPRSATSLMGAIKSSKLIDKAEQQCVDSMRAFSLDCFSKLMENGGSITEESDLVFSPFSLYLTIHMIWTCHADDKGNENNSSIRQELSKLLFLDNGGKNEAAPLLKLIENKSTITMETSVQARPNYMTKEWSKIIEQDYLAKIGELNSNTPEEKGMFLKFDSSVQFSSSSSSSTKGSQKKLTSFYFSDLLKAYEFALCAEGGEDVNDIVLTVFLADDAGHLKELSVRLAENKGQLLNEVCNGMKPLVKRGGASEYLPSLGEFKIENSKSPKNLNLKISSLLNSAEESCGLHLEEIFLKQGSINADDNNGEEDTLKVSTHTSFLLKRCKKKEGLPTTTKKLSTPAQKEESSSSSLYLFLIRNKSNGLILFMGKKKLG